MEHRFPPFFSMVVVSGSPKRWDRWHSPSPRFGKDYKWYISGIYCQLGDGLCHRSHLLGEPETTIDYLVGFCPPRLLSSHLVRLLRLYYPMSCKWLITIVRFRSLGYMAYVNGL